MSAVSLNGHSSPCPLGTCALFLGLLWAVMVEGGWWLDVLTERRCLWCLVGVIFRGVSGRWV